MGMDIVEIVMRVEEEFSVSIPDARASEMARVGDVRDFVVATLRERGEVIDEADVWARLREVVVSQLGVKPEEVTPESRFVEDLGAD